MYQEKTEPIIEHYRKKNVLIEIEEHGIKIKSDEMDFEKSYQVILKIDKTEE